MKILSVGLYLLLLCQVIVLVSTDPGSPKTALLPLPQVGALGPELRGTVQSPLPQNTAYGLVSLSEEHRIYTIKSRVRLRSGPGLNYKVLHLLEYNQTLILIKKKGNWFQIKTLADQKGFVRKDMVTDTWIKVYKKERILLVCKGNKILKRFPLALSPSNPLGDKICQGDCGTPEGRFYICDMVDDPNRAIYGGRSMWLSYPNMEDARRGLKAGIINKKTCSDIVARIRKGLIPNQNTPLGGAITIHGGGSRSDWTLGCVALEDRDVREVFALVGRGTRVEIYKSKDQEKVQIFSSLEGYNWQNNW